MTRDALGTILSVLAALLTGGCTQQPQSKLPSLIAEQPPTALTLSWNGERYEVPAAQIIPARTYIDELPRWGKHHSAFWRIPLEGSEFAIAVTTRDASGTVAIGSMSTYRSDGTLRLEQLNADARPNVPGYWITYGADGRTREVEVLTATESGRRYICEVVFYENGHRTRRYEVDPSQLVQVEDKIADDGVATAVNVRPGLR